MKRKAKTTEVDKKERQKNKELMDTLVAKYDKLCYYFVTRILPENKLLKPDKDALSYLPKKSDRYLRFLSEDLTSAPKTEDALYRMFCEMYTFDSLYKRTSAGKELVRSLTGDDIDRISAIELKKLTSLVRSEEDVPFDEKQDAVRHLKTMSDGSISSREISRYVEKRINQPDSRTKSDFTMDDSAICFAITISAACGEDVSDAGLYIALATIKRVKMDMCRQADVDLGTTKAWVEKVFDTDKFMRRFTDDCLSEEDAVDAGQNLESEEFFEKAAKIKSDIDTEDDRKKALEIIANMSLSTQTAVAHCIKLYKMAFSLYAKQKLEADKKADVKERLKEADRAIKEASAKESELAKLKEMNESLKWQLNDLAQKEEKQSRIIDHLNKEIENIVSSDETDAKEEEGKEDENTGIETEEELEEEIVKLDEMTGVLQKKRIALVGGADNLTSKLVQIFPDWLYIGAKGTVNKEQVAGKDYIVMMTGYLSHATCYTVQKAARECGIPICYIRGTNIDKIVKRTYAAVREADETGAIAC